jgi:thymidylate synthase ThyX
MYKAEVIAASRNTHGQRITTMLVTFPRIVLAELNTHRMFTRNSASSRAIPFKRMLAAVEDNPFVPLRFQKQHSGMQGTEYWEGDDHEFRKNLWLRARRRAVEGALDLDHAGTTKQLCNRLLEPFAWHTALITSTEWENYFALRANEAADIHIEHLAQLMLEAYNTAEVKQLQPGQWHMPFSDKLPWVDQELADGFTAHGQVSKVFDESVALKVCTARCAQTSYTLLGDDEKPLDVPKLIALHDRLARAGHWSPFEHCAKAMDRHEYYHNVRGYFERHTSELDMLNKDSDMYGWCGNFQGFIQYRKLFTDENRKDPRVIH